MHSISSQYQNSAGSSISESLAANSVSKTPSNRENQSNRVDKEDRASYLARTFIFTGHLTGALVVAGILPSALIAAPLIGILGAVVVCAMEPAESEPQENKRKEKEEKFQLKKLG